MRRSIQEMYDGSPHLQLLATPLSLGALGLGL